MINEPVAAWPLSEVAAQQINRLRRAAGLTREQLAAACQAAGGPESLSASAIANIETGRPDATGRRRRDLTVEELVIFGRALGVPPLLLLFPFDRVREVEVLPGAVAPAWSAAAWFAGRVPFPHWEKRDSTGEVIAEMGDPADLEAFERGAVAFDLWESHARLLADWRHRTWSVDQAKRRMETATDDAERDTASRAAQLAEREAERATNSLWAVRRQMRQHGILTPELPEQLREIDTDKSPLQRAITQSYADREEAQE